jgi:glutamyl-tRNA reductase
MDIDSIRECQEATLAKRRAAVPVVEAIIEEELRAWEQWHARRPMEQVIKALYLETAARSCELTRKWDSPGGLSPAQTEHVVYQSFKKLLHEHVHRLRRLPLTGEPKWAGG